MLKVPVALIFFNRPEKLKATFEQIKQAKPTKLFLIQDGPREGNYEKDIKNIKECRKIVEDINWDCEVIRDYSKVNLGCGLRPSTGITNAFKKTDKLIILEDDCVADKSFFTFCDKMLTKYNDDDRIILISGMNLLNSFDSEYSYTFSKLCTIGAWATWKRVWDKYDFEIRDFDKYDVKKKLKNNIKNQDVLEQKFWAWNLTREKIKYNEKIDWWDYQFHFQLYLNDGLGIVPCKNLIENIGYGDDASHVSNKDEALHFQLTMNHLDKNIKYPKKVVYDGIYDNKIYKIQNIKVSKFRIFLSKIKRIIIRLLRRNNNG